MRRRPRGGLGRRLYKNCKNKKKTTIFSNRRPPKLGWKMGFERRSRSEDTSYSAAAGKQINLNHPRNHIQNNQLHPKGGQGKARFFV